MILALLLAMFLTSCGSPQHLTEVAVEARDDGTTLFSGNAMTMHYRILVGKTLPAAQQTVVAKIIAECFGEVNDIYNKWNPLSELSRLNKVGKDTPTTVSPELLALLYLTDRVVKDTGGRFDPTIEPIQRLWKEKLAGGEIPTNKEIEQLAPAIGWKNIRIDGNSFTKGHDATEIDLGGIAKGYAIDLLVNKIVAEGFGDLYVEWGGELRATGKHPQGRPWTVYISNLDDDDPAHAIATVEIHDSALATSGDYLQNTTVNGVTYFHIIDPRTLRPLVATPTSIASATVLADTCAYADGLATAAMLFPNEEASVAWFNSLEHPHLQLWLLSR